ncbi:single-stranded DNA-binding protein [Natranaerobius thermophilus]|uniref:Single-stranded DNA-binding protein n=1 Tax=Natranaerobius thermophilus (strain ATCC BAA-1301 / DSM 18059 / JW/NM-WN-LF) TaxID=457570 RepID=B2A455_NATTJ|nr:single-stranded DNA-binding protein [Natranaerobius thermophilus]ACB86461.1 single-strand binding protein [Natranaerobius thermophilus JW/NM-WN-LF]
MLNQVVLIGRLTRDPELRYTPGNGVAVCNFGLAVQRPFTNRQGEREADFINIVTWRKVAEQCANHLGKGRMVAVSGRIQMRNYETQEGQKRRVAEVVGENVQFLDWPKGSSGGSNSYGGQDSGDTQVEGDEFGIGGEEYQVEDDDVPF